MDTHKQVSLVTIMFFTLVGVMVSMTSAYSGGKATPKNMDKIFIGRCEEYQHVLRPDLFKNGYKNCTDLWQKFYQAFAYKDPCNVTVESYKSFVDATSHEVDTKDKVMYWSGSVYPMVVEYARVNNHKYMTIREILAAYVIRNIEDWCGQVQPPGVNYQTCPSWGSCPLLATSTFWTALSKSFAQQVRGTVHLMLSGSSGVAYNRSSIFAHSELKNLDKSRTPNIHVHLAYDLKEPIKKEKCGQGTLEDLRQDVLKKGMTFQCTDNDLDVLYFQCVPKMGADRCKSIGWLSASASKNQADSRSIVFGVPLLLTTLMLMTNTLSS